MKRHWRGKIDWRFVFFVLVANFLFLLVCLYAFEWLHHEPFTGIKRSENNRVYSWGVPVTFNKEGFREREITPKRKGEYRVMVIGDSFTLGVGLQTNERYSNRLEAMLNERYPNVPIEVLNFSNGGNNTAEEEKILEKYAAVVQPNIIIVGFCINDLEMGMYNKDWTKFQEHWARRIDWFPKYMSRIGLHFTGIFTRDCIYQLIQVLHIVPMWDDALDQIYQRGTPEWENYMQALRGIKKISDQMKLPPPVMLMLNQSVSRWRSGSDYAAPSRRLKRVLRMYHLAEEGAKEAGFTTINYEHEFATELHGASLRLNKYDAHPSAAMHAVYARKLFDTVFKNGLPR